MLVQLALQFAAVALLGVVRQEADLRRRGAVKASAPEPYTMHAVIVSILLQYCLPASHLTSSAPLPAPQLLSCSHARCSAQLPCLLLTVLQPAGEAA